MSVHWIKISASLDCICFFFFDAGLFAGAFMLLIDDNLQHPKKDSNASAQIAKGRGDAHATVIAAHARDGALSRRCTVWKRGRHTSPTAGGRGVYRLAGLPTLAGRDLIFLRCRQHRV